MTAELTLYRELLADIKVRVREAQIKAVLAANAEMILMYWDIGLGNIYQTGEQRREATIRNYRIVRLEGAREFARAVEHYNLDAIIAVGFRLNSARAIQFRQRASGVLRD